MPDNTSLSSMNSANQSRDNTKRRVCQHCLKPEKACICRFFTDIDNEMPVVILQHPTEVKQSKGSVPLLSGSLKNSTVIVGENFDQSAQFNDILQTYGDKVRLLYPGESATIIDENYRKHLDGEDLTEYCLVLLDGTWKKVYRMFMVSTCLRELSMVALPQGFVSQYQIRKTRKDNAFSTLEACGYALSLLEGSSEKYQPLLASFADFNQFHQRFVPTHK